LANHLARVHTYSGVLFRLKQLPVAKEHFDRWMELFTQTTDSLFTGALADEASCKEHGRNV
jgi:hemoglobin